MAVFPTDDQTGRRIPSDDLPLYSAGIKRNLEALLRVTRGKMMICIENYGIGPDELTLLEPYLGRDNLFLCWDLVKSADNPDVEDFYLAHPELIRQVHLHDRREVSPGSFKGHRVIGTGNVDFIGHLEFLMRNADVEDFCIEVRPREKAKESLSALTKIIRNIR